jgi:hypothetical protein
MSQAWAAKHMTAKYIVLIDTLNEYKDRNEENKMYIFIILFEALLFFIKTIYYISIKNRQCNYGISKTK